MLLEQNVSRRPARLGLQESNLFTIRMATSEPPLPLDSPIGVSGRPPHVHDNDAAAEAGHPHSATATPCEEVPSWC